MHARLDLVGQRFELADSRLDSRRLVVPLRFGRLDRRGERLDTQGHGRDLLAMLLDQGATHAVRPDRAGR